MIGLKKPLAQPDPNKAYIIAIAIAVSISFPCFHVQYKHGNISSCEFSALIVSVFCGAWKASFTVQVALSLLSLYELLDSSRGDTVLHTISVLIAPSRCRRNNFSFSSSSWWSTFAALRGFLQSYLIGEAAIVAVKSSSTLMLLCPVISESSVLLSCASMYAILCTQHTTFGMQYGADATMKLSSLWCP